MHQKGPILIFIILMRIYYGVSDQCIDVTHICLEQLTKQSILTIPNGDIVRSSYFTDPLHGIKKSIFVETNDRITEFNDGYTIKINTMDNTILTMHENEIMDKITILHSTLKIKYGQLQEEYPEQKMTARYLTGKEKVLEIGGNIGRNTLMIASLLEDDRNLVTLESDTHIAKQLTENRELNGFHFHIECSALSKRKLIQKGWDTFPSDTLQEGYTWVNTLDLYQLNQKYSILFDTLVLDCEGAFYYILMDMPEILNHIQLIIMENDYHDIQHKLFVDDMLKKNNFYVDYYECGGWGPCYSHFFEVWKRA